jgi:large subunit ribosomal protein L4
MTIDVVNLGGEKVGSLELADEVFGAVNEDLLWEAVKHYRAGQRAGTHATKNRKLVSGSGKKLWRQKGTGRARVGSIRSPLWRHGGTVHGPQPRSYDYRFPRKKLLGALRSALAAKLADGRLMVVENFQIEEPKTKAFRKTLDTLNAKGTTLLVESATTENHNLHLSSRNLEGVELVMGNQVHPYHLLRYESVIFARPALEKLQESLRGSVPKHPTERDRGARRGPRRRRHAEVA